MLNMVFMLFVTVAIVMVVDKGLVKNCKDFAPGQVFLMRLSMMFAEIVIAAFFMKN